MSRHRSSEPPRRRPWLWIGIGAFLFGLASVIMLGLGLSGEMPTRPRSVPLHQTSEISVSPAPTPGPLETSIGVVTPCDPGKNNENVQHCLEP